jgi:hypothetical protein
MVKVLSQAALMSMKDHIAEYGRPLEVAYFAHLIGESTVDPILQELGKFQNADGGFGHGLEPDFWLPASSPMATSMAFRLLTGLPVDAAQPMIQRGMDYYEATFQPRPQQWQPTGPEVNQYPHAPWWHMDEKSAQESVDGEALDPDTWDGNPSAEILGHLLKYRRSTSKLDLEALVERALTYLKQQQRYETHEIQCYLKLYEHLPQTRQAEILPVLQRAIAQLVEPDTSQWGNYVPKPLDFVQSPDSPFYPDLEELVQVQLDDLVDEIEQHGSCTPTWDWGHDEENWQKAREMWMGMLTCGCVASLKKFDRVEEE